MQRGIAPSLTFFAVFLLTTTSSPAQFPGEVPQNAEPPAASTAAPGNLDLNAIDRQAPPTGLGGPALRQQAPAPAAAVVAGSPVPVATPGYGYIHQFGSFQIMGTSAEGMFMLSANLPFPDGRRSVDFYRARLNYVGRYVDPSGISGYIYETQVGGPVNDKRYFLFGDQDLNIADGDSNGIRWIVYYNGKGSRTYSTTARFYKP